jgi:pyruvate/2-oxoglutarate dehydrogenase complex dihydrolipoamide dehydrogenase (E3) component
LPYTNLLSRGRVIRDRAASVSSNRIFLSSGYELSADYIVLATGSTYPFPAKSTHLETGRALKSYQGTHEALVAAERTLLLGAGPVGIELAGEISTAWPDKKITILDRSPEILTGSYGPALRAELRRQLLDRGIELLLGTRLTSDPTTPSAELSPTTLLTDDGRELAADIWFRCHGVAPVSDYLGSDLVSARAPNGRLQVDEQMRLAGHTTVFAVGDVTKHNPGMAFFASLQAETVATNIRALIEGRDELSSYQQPPPTIAVPLGPMGGAGEVPAHGGLVGPETISRLKGKGLFVDQYADILGVQR